MSQPPPSFHLRQLRAGPMANYVYVIGDPVSRKAAVVDPAWEIDRIVEQVAADGYEIDRILITHYHPDHLGGDMMGQHIEGAIELLGKVKARLYLQKAEVPWTRRLLGLAASDVVSVEGGDVAEMGSLAIKFLHTPGHTPGSQCFLVGSSLISGDTLFIGACGRVDLPGANPEQMYHSLNVTLRNLPEETQVYPGHAYAPESSSTIGNEKRHNPFLRFNSMEEFLAAMGYRR